MDTDVKLLQLLDLGMGHATGLQEGLWLSERVGWGEREGSGGPGPKFLRTRSFPEVPLDKPENCRFWFLLAV